MLQTGSLLWALHTQFPLIATLFLSSGMAGSFSLSGDPGLIPGLGRSPGGGHGKPLQYSCLENPHGWRSLAGCSPWGRRELNTTERLSTQHFSWPVWVSAQTSPAWRGHRPSRPAAPASTCCPQGLILCPCLVILPATSPSQAVPSLRAGS